MGERQIGREIRNSKIKIIIECRTLNEISDFNIRISDLLHENVFHQLSLSHCQTRFRIRNRPNVLSNTGWQYNRLLYQLPFRGACPEDGYNISR